MQLKPVLGPIQLIFYGVGVIIGAGVYSVIGTAAGLAQQSLWLSFIIGAIVALLTGFSYAEMTTSFPRAGAEYLYLRRALPKSDWAAFGVGILILMGGAATAATVAVAFGGYLRIFFDIPIWFSALALLVACTAFNIWGLREFELGEHAVHYHRGIWSSSYHCSGTYAREPHRAADGTAVTRHSSRSGNCILCLSGVRRDCEFN